MISVPHLDGPAVEHIQIEHGVVRCLWLLPITALEEQYAEENGVDALETRLEAAQVDYLDCLCKGVA